MLYDLEAINTISKDLSTLGTLEEASSSLLEEIKTLIPYNLAIFNLTKTSSKGIDFYYNTMNSDYSKEFEHQFLADYDYNYGEFSYTRWLHLENRSIVIKDTDLFSDSIRKESRYYQEYINKNGFDYVLNCILAHNNKTFSGITFYREIGAPDFSDYEVTLLNLLIPTLTLTLTLFTDFVSPPTDATILQKAYFTNKEEEILDLLYNGYSNDEVARSLFISRNTVKKHIYNIFKKTNIKSRNKLISYLHDKNYNTANKI